MSFEVLLDYLQYRIASIQYLYCISEIVSEHSLITVNGIRSSPCLLLYGTSYVNVDSETLGLEHLQLCMHCW